MIIDSPKAKDIPLLKSLWKEAFGDSDEFLKAFFDTAFSPYRSRRITIDGTTVAALYWFDATYNEKRVAYVYAVATAKAYRGLGLCHILMNDTHIRLKSLGYDAAILVPGNNRLFDFYSLFGYETCAYIKEFNPAKSNKKVSITKIDKYEYAKLRRKYLPDYSVIQEGDNLDFLETYASFYKGCDFVLTAYGKKDTLHGVELLGNVSYAGDIVNTLGYKNGIFRTAGSERPFGMYKSLDKSELTAPLYFGLAFD